MSLALNSDATVDAGDKEINNADYPMASFLEGHLISQ